MRQRLRTATAVIGSILAWEVLARVGPWPHWLFPGPLAVGERLIEVARDGRLGAAVLRSMGRLAQGYGLSIAVGVPLGVALARSALVRAAVRPFVVGLQALPSICWLPLALLWFGLSEAAIVFVVVMGSLLAIAIATEDAVTGVDPVLLRAAGTLGVRRLRFVAGVLLPAAMPGILTGLKLGWSFAWRALMSGELLFVAGGLGQLLQAGRELLDPALVMGVMAAIVAIGVAIDHVLFRIVELRVRRRWGLGELATALALVAVLGGAGCSRGREGGPLRVGYFPNVTHAQALVGLDDGTFARAVAAGVDARQFNAGPAEMEALLGGDLDVGYVGPGPAVIAHLRSRGEGVRVIAGAASGGAVLVVRPEVKGPPDLAGRRVASPQLGNTQDVALRTWLRQQGLPEGSGPGKVEVTPLANADILGQLSGRGLAGAWVPEPWGARMVAEAGARILVDERTLWPDGRFPTALVVVSPRALQRRRADVEAFLRAHLTLTRRWREDAAGFARLANECYGRRAGKALAPAVLADAFSRLEPLDEPLPDRIAELTRHAQALGFAPAGDVAGLVDPSALAAARRPAGR
jgi:ABC-type nitrate/sulfonate/bicarbonate transport system permease component/ABC-type nitrate/sulfonate/bicarbonate transport system substrate-binding protein